jgi:SpoVK/Ycf46/Vps4 family AAA+-type ATPase
MSAAALGHEAGLPVYVVRLDAIVGSYLGETASRVHSVLRWAATRESVLVLDEVDAIARRRGHVSDVAELDRVVVALLQELEHTTPAGFLVATTNRLEDLDSALFRRFDLVMNLPQPTRAHLAEFSEREAATLDVRLTPKLRKTAISARSFADAFRVLEDAARRQLLLGPEALKS